MATGGCEQRCSAHTVEGAAQHDHIVGDERLSELGDEEEGDNEERGDVDGHQRHGELTHLQVGG